MSSSSGWCTIESDPGVFSELIRLWGVKGTEVAEIWDLNDPTFIQSLSPYGLIFLFKWQSNLPQAPSAGSRLLDSSSVPSLFFARQVINNACATQALLSILLNRPEIDLGDELKNFKEFTMALPSDVRGELIGSSDSIRTAHNSFSRPEPFLIEEKSSKATDDDDVYHFISYVPFEKALYELDGLKRGPVHICDLNGSNPLEWVEKAIGAIQERCKTYAEKEIRFNLLALVKEKSTELKEEIAALESRLSNAQGANTTETEAVAMAEGERAFLESELKEKRERLDEEEEKKKRWREENIRRKHNYVPLIFNLLKGLADNGKLNELKSKAREIHDAKVAEKRQKKEKEAEKK